MLSGEDFTVPNLNARIRGQLGPASRVQLGRRAAIMAQQTTYSMSGPVTLRAAVHQECASASPSEHQCGAKPGGTASDNHAIP
ncbi:hypothetical protein MMARJ_48670 [Mycobacterium marseillense]|uniref:Uncharacterized protein n=1 Tax=Mycobacterium marseillense TaxID=701042 RepID=A0ABM7JJF4_9MYCO|nr:hypothetical protein MMARJ_48670 [Mycobacterium marseillense]